MYKEILQLRERHDVWDGTAEQIRLDLKIRQVGQAADVRDRARDFVDCEESAWIGQCCRQRSECAYNSCSDDSFDTSGNAPVKLL